MASAAAQHNRPPFQDLEDNVENGPVLVGSPTRVIEKIFDYHAAYGHQVLSISVDGLTEAEQREQVEWFATEVASVLRRELPNPVWSQGTPTAAQAAFQPAAVPALSPVFAL